MKHASANVREESDNYSEMNWDGHSGIWNVERCKRSAVLDSFQWRLAHKDVRTAVRPLNNSGKSQISVIKYFVSRNAHSFNLLDAELNSTCHLLALLGAHPILHVSRIRVNPLKPELNPICYLLALLAHHFLHVSRIRVKSLTFRSLTLYIY